ncbi:MAG: hypothetical protein J5692_00190 [Bacteroidales bacterium]|nr:hypothetical protein [Bacteroidales bacterium]
MANTISFKIKIEGSNELKTVTFSAEELGKALDAVRNNAKTLNGELVNMGAISQVLDGVNNAIGQLNDIMSNLAGAYTAQVEAETKLATAMRNTMDASDEEIASIKQLASEQQKIGIVSADVQLAASQELATYLGLSSSLETIIPTMNDMIAQQLGLGASAESATQIATMLGKVMNGQTSALSRYGYEFTEAQEAILKFGDESERAAVLCQVIGESVGGMNEALAQTDVGRQQQLANKLSDISAMLGGLVQPAQAFVSTLAKAGQAVTSITQLYQAIKKVTEIESVATAISKLYAAAQHLLAKAGYTAAAGTRAMNLAVTALYATLTMGLTLAVQGLVALFTKLGNKGKEAAEGVDTLSDAQKAYTEASMNVRLELAEETTKLESLIKSKQDASKAVKDLNARYGEIFGSHKTASEWYDVLTQKSAAYAKQLGYEAQAKVIASQKAAKELEKIDKEIRMRELANWAEEQKRQNPGTYNRGSLFKKNAEEYHKLEAEVSTLDTEIAGLQGSFDTCTQSMAAAAQELGTVVTTTVSAGKDTKSLSDDIADYRKSVEHAVQANQAFGGTISDAEVKIKAMRSGITSLIEKYGTESATIQELISEYQDLRRAKEEANGISPVSRALPDTIKTGKFTSVSSRPTAKPTIGTTTYAKREEYEAAYQKIQEIKGRLPGTDPETQKILQSQIKTLRELYNIPEEKTSSIQGSVDAFSALGDAIGNLSGLVDEGAASWLTWGANLLKAIGQALPQLAALFAGETAVAGAGAMSSVASIPYVGPILAVAALASIVAAAATLPKFAEGGLAYGPTLGLFGEYANARTNPEVVAPLSRLKELIGNDGSGKTRIVGRISGRDILLIEERTRRLDERSNG